MQAVKCTLQRVFWFHHINKNRDEIGKVPGWRGTINDHE